MSSAAPVDPITGHLRLADGTAVVRIEARFGNHVDEVWSALTEPPQLDHWLGRVEGELRAGGGFRAYFHASGWEGSGQIEVCEPRRRFVVRTREDDGPAEHEIEVAVGRATDATVVVVEERGMPVELLAAYGAGVQIHVEDLAAHLAGGDRCEAKTRWDELFPSYEAQAADLSPSVPG
jgi:uncharacterized protein YndB with AHSA1/START domain